MYMKRKKKRTNATAIGTNESTAMRCIEALFERNATRQSRLPKVRKKRIENKKKTRNEKWSRGTFFCKFDTC
jgi:hypothetical protein